MSTVSITLQTRVSDGWRFEVEVKSGKEKNHYSILLDEVYWKKITGEEFSPEDLVKLSFKFLLKREPPEAILKEFNLEQISTYFPEYEKTIKKSA